MKKEEKKVVVSKKEPTSRKKYVAESNKTIKKKASHESIFKKISKLFNSYLFSNLKFLNKYKRGIYKHES